MIKKMKKMMFKNNAKYSIRYFLVTLMLFSSVFANPKIVLFNDTSAWYHWGCTGTSTALKEGIQQLGFEIEAIPINTPYKQIPSFEFFDDQEMFTQFCDLNREIIEKIQHADAAVITGEGTFHDLRTRPMHLLYLAHLAKRYFGKHVEIINHSAYPNDDPIFSEEQKSEEEYEQARHIYKTIYIELDFIAI